MNRSINISGSNLQGNFAMGDNSTSISYGDQSLNAKTMTGNFDLLSNDLARHGVKEQDLSSLRTALASDQAATEITQKKFGPAVSNWMQEMFGKAINASWQIEIGVVGGLLSDALKRYYGWP